MRIFLDTNILIDFLAKRSEFFIPAWGVGVLLAEAGKET